MAGPPSPKRQRTDGKAQEHTDEQELAHIQEMIDSVAKIDEELDEPNGKLAKEILALEAKYDAIKRPTYLKRAKILGKIPKFWKQCITNHPELNQMMGDGDEALLDYLSDVDVELIDEHGGYKIQMVFESNPYFTNKMLWKQVKFDESGDPTASASSIEWKDAPEAKKAIESCSMVESFLSTEEFELDEEIKDHVWKTPVEYYLNLGSFMVEADDEDDDEDGEEDDEDDGEDDSGEDPETAGKE